MVTNSIHVLPIYVDLKPCTLMIYLVYNNPIQLI